MNLKVIVLGAQGLIGQTLLEVLYQRHPDLEVIAVGSSRAVEQGECVQWGEDTLALEAIDTVDFHTADVVLSALPSDVARCYVPKAAAAGCFVIDHSTAFRQDPDVPLVIPEINGKCLAEQPSIIANPNCSTIQLCMALKPLYDAVGITRVNVSTYQSVSGVGQEGLSTLLSETAQVLNGMNISESEVFPAQMAFNVVPQIDAFNENGYTREEMKLYDETQKIFNDPDLMVNATAVRVPVFHGHSESVHCECKSEISVKAAKALFSNMPGVSVLDDAVCLTPMTHGNELEEVWVSRIRQDITHPYGLNFWIVADNLLKGGALNTVQIIEAWYSPETFGFEQA
ncbi:MAG: aspartate-semialdehyde dehydrogenase [Legionellales bacterium]|nr:aspartate-semialdehyde dehydrogenase [Legionellales bacterium]|tara:strand:- start:293 stop:1318 length:1026 start_codon:yes stop_codon:yes gene_type:complete